VFPQNVAVRTAQIEAETFDLVGLKDAKIWEYAV
jgi:hypothetical protein